jgi:hypothetical protein
MWDCVLWHVPNIVTSEHVPHAMSGVWHWQLSAAKLLGQPAVPLWNNAPYSFYWDSPESVSELNAISDCKSVSSNCVYGGAILKWIIGWQNVNWIQVARLTSRPLHHGDDLSNSIKKTEWLTNWANISFSMTRLQSTRKLSFKFPPITKPVNIPTEYCWDYKHRYRILSHKWPGISLVARIPNWLREYWMWSAARALNSIGFTSIESDWPSEYWI